MQIRNQFAHSRRTQHVTLAINEAKSETTIVEEKIMMSSINGSGELLAVDTAKALDEFTQQWVKVSDYLRELRKKKKI
jgi:hypothetical protein